jgi:hypothetical protein
VYLIDPVDTEEGEAHPGSQSKSKLALLVERLMRKLRREPHPAEELFSGAMQEAMLFDDLLRKVGGDRSVVERLIGYEKRLNPGATRLSGLLNAISRWERENKR